MMSVIALEGMRFFAPIGHYEEERILGNEFIIDVYMEVKIEAAAKSDELTQTVNYEIIHRICLMEMRKPAKLIENAAQRIVEGIEKHYPDLHGLKLRLRKMHPPVSGPVHSAYIEVQKGSFGGVKFKTLKQLKDLLENWKDLRKKFEQL